MGTDVNRELGAELPFPKPHISRKVSTTPPNHQANKSSVFINFVSSQWKLDLTSVTAESALVNMKSCSVIYWMTLKEQTPHYSNLDVGAPTFVSIIVVIVLTDKT